MANYEKLMKIASLTVKHVNSQLAPEEHLSSRAHFDSESEVKERMRRERMVNCSSFNGELTPNQLYSLISQNLEYDIASLEIESNGRSPLGLERKHGEIIMHPLDADDNAMRVGFLVNYNRESRTYKTVSCYKIRISVSWEEFENGEVCDGTFSIITLFPIR